MNLLKFLASFQKFPTSLVENTQKISQSFYMGACTWLTKFAPLGVIIVHVAFTGVIDEKEKAF